MTQVSYKEAVSKILKNKKPTVSESVYRKKLTKMFSREFYETFKT